MVNFKPTEEQELLRDTLQSFAREVLRPKAREADEKDGIPTEIVQKGWDLGLVQTSIPEEHGGYGSGRSAIRSAIKLEELAYGDLSMAMHLLTPRLLTVPLIIAGTPEQQRAWLPRFCGKTFTAATAALAEPVWNFDARQPATRAERTGGDYVLSGKKCLVPLADRADAILVYASTADGLGAFVVERGAAGVTIGSREKNLGIKALDTFPVAFEQVRVPAANRLGGDGANVQALIDASRVATAALAVGVSRAAFDYAREYAKERKAFGVAIARKQAIAFMLADMATEIDAMRLLAWEAAWRIDQGLPATRESYLARHYAAQASLKIADNALQVLGGHGYIRDHLVELFLRNARGFATLDGLAIV
jgi:alkylation response protein AidB-like acyl-CoA dehydrogenase